VNSIQLGWSSFFENSLGRDLNFRRIERYLALALESGARPVVLLTKADLCEEPAEALAEIERVVPFVSVHVVSALGGNGIGALAAYLGPGQPVCCSAHPEWANRRS
jgi:ribosome biogenesis GTPase / thiamine phosphate phosphatase